MVGHDVVLRDIDDDLVQEGLVSIQENLEKGIDLGKVDPETRNSALAHLDGTTSLETLKRYTERRCWNDTLN